MRRVRVRFYFAAFAAIGACQKAAPHADIAPPDADFGSVEATVKNTRCPQGVASNPMTLTVTSPRNGLGYTLTMSPGDFRWDPDTTFPQTFPRGKSTYTVPIVFRPTYTGDHKAVASIILNDPQAAPSNIVDLKGKGVCEF
jgi:hypothetical protein